MRATNLPVAVTLISSNRAGSVFSNASEGFTVIRWTNHANLSYCVDLVDGAFQELSMSGSDLLVFDIQDLPWTCSGVAVQALIQDALLEKLVGTLVCVGKQTLLSAQPAAVELQDLARAENKHLLFVDNLSEATQRINDTRKGTRLLQANHPANFQSGYGGSVYSLPEYAATVVSLSGVMWDAALPAEILREAFNLHKRTGARTWVIDTSACAPLTTEEQYTFVYREAIQPLTNGGVDNVIHVRVPGDVFWTKDTGQTISELLTSLGVPSFEVANMQDCILLLNTLRGNQPLARPEAAPPRQTIRAPSTDVPFKH
jgi:hypothetical protein